MFAVSQPPSGASALPPGQWVPVPDTTGPAGVPRALRREGAYLPPPLPSDLVLPPATYRVCAEAEHALGRLDEAVRRSERGPGLVRATRIRDAVASAGMSGTATTLREAFAAELLSARGAPRRDALGRDLEPYLRAYELGLARVRAGAPADTALVGEMSACMTGRDERGAEDALRRAPGWLGVTPRRAYLLTATGAHLVGALEQWNTWVREEDAQPRVAKAALAHYQLEVLQPFPTANGHVARAFTAVELVRCGLLHDQVLPLSVWLPGALPEYQRRIRAVVDTRLVHPWVEFYAGVIRDQALAQLNLVAALEALAAEHARLLPLKGTRPRVAVDLIDWPVVDHQAICDRYGVTRRAASGYTAELVRKKILVQWKLKGHRSLFVCWKVLRLLSRNPATSAMP